MISSFVCTAWLDDLADLRCSVMFANDVFGLMSSVDVNDVCTTYHRFEAQLRNNPGILRDELCVFRCCA